MSNETEWDRIMDVHEERSERYLQLLPDTDDLTLITLKGHLVVEEMLHAIVKSHCTFPEHLEDVRLSFAQLASLTKALINLPTDESVFPAILKLNKLRNHLAHNLNTDLAEKLANEFVSLCKKRKTKRADFRATTERLAEDLRYSVGYVLGRLQVMGGVSEILQSMRQIGGSRRKKRAARLSDKPRSYRRKSSPTGRHMGTVRIEPGSRGGSRAVRVSKGSSKSSWRRGRTAV